MRFFAHFFNLCATNLLKSDIFTRKEGNSTSPLGFFPKLKSFHEKDEGLFRKALCAKDNFRETIQISQAPPSAIHCPASDCTLPGKRFPRLRNSSFPAKQEDLPQIPPVFQRNGKGLPTPYGWHWLSHRPNNPRCVESQ